jgi:hypothetical protein
LKTTSWHRGRAAPRRKIRQYHLRAQQLAIIPSASLGETAFQQLPTSATACWLHDCGIAHTFVGKRNCGSVAQAALLSRARVMAAFHATPRSTTRCSTGWSLKR